MKEGVSSAMLSLATHRTCGSNHQPGEHGHHGSLQYGPSGSLGVAVRERLAPSAAQPSCRPAEGSRRGSGGSGGCRGSGAGSSARAPQLQEHPGVAAGPRASRGLLHPNWPLTTEVCGLSMQQLSHHPDLFQKHQLLFHLSSWPAICYLN